MRKEAILLFFVFISLFIRAQSWTTPYDEKIEFSLKELSINEKFQYDLDSTIFFNECPNLEDKRYKYFAVAFTKKCGFYEVRMELLRLPIIYGNGVGYFFHNNYIFIVAGDIPGNVFFGKNIYKKFSYMAGEIPIPESFPDWNFIYKNGSLKLVNFNCL